MTREFEAVPITPFQQWLADRFACAQARIWVADKTVAQAWADADNKNWMEWLLERLQVIECTCPSNSCPFYKMADLDIDGLRTTYPYESWKYLLPPGIE